MPGLLRSCAEYAVALRRRVNSCRAACQAECIHFQFGLSTRAGTEAQVTPSRHRVQLRGPNLRLSAALAAVNSAGS